MSEQLATTGPLQVDDVEQLYPPEGFDFGDGRIIEVPFKLRGRAGILREADGETAKHFRAASLRGAEMVFGENDTRIIRNLAGSASAELVLLAGCCFWVSKDDKGRPTENKVPIGEIIRWPGKMRRQLFDTAKRISDLDEQPDNLETLRKQRDSIIKKIETLEAKERAIANGKASEADPTTKQLENTTDGSD